MTRRSAAVLLLLLSVPFDLHAQSDVAPRIRRVERGLLTPTVLKDAATTGYALADRMAMYRVPGVSIAVINDGRIEWAKGYGVTEAGTTTPVDTSTLFQAASISKPVAAMAALRLVEQGKLSLDEDVNATLRSWHLPDNAFTRAQKVTLRRLLSHNGGTTVHGFRGYAQGEAVPTLTQVLDGERPANSAAVRVDTLPGAIWRYSGGGTTIVQLMMQEVSGRSFPVLLRETVLRPAGMIHSTYEQPLPPDRAAHAATGHRQTGLAVTGKWHTYPEMFAAGLWTTPSDLARLAIEVQRSLRGESNRIISRAMMQQMLTVQAGEYGLGFGIGHSDGAWTFSHGGANEGFRAFFIAFADRGQGAVIMTNGDSGGVLANEIVRAIGREYGWPIMKPVERATAPIDATTLAAIAGSYRGEVDGRPQLLTVRLDGNTLTTMGPPFGQRTLYHAGANTFFMIDGPGELRFERAADGNFTHVVVTAQGREVRLERQPTTQPERAPVALAPSPLGALRGPIEARIATHRGVVGVGVIDLKTGDSLSIRGNEPFPTASVIKMAVLVELFHQVYNGKLHLDDPIILLEADKKPGSGILQFLSAPHQMTIADAALLMIAHSDNTAANLLIDKVGIRAAGMRMDSLGLRRTKLHSKLFLRETSVAPDSSAKYGVGVSTPMEMARLFAMLYQGKVVNAEASAQMIELLKKQLYREMIPRYLPGATIANKTGSVNASRIDCGIVYDNGRDFALCVFTNENQDRSWRIDNEAHVVIADIARIVHGGLTGSAAAR